MLIVRAGLGWVGSLRAQTTQLGWVLLFRYFGVDILDSAVLYTQIYLTLCGSFSSL